MKVELVPTLRRHRVLIAILVVLSLVFLQSRAHNQSDAASITSTTSTASPSNSPVTHIAFGLETRHVFLQHTLSHPSVVCSSRAVGRPMAPATLWNLADHANVWLKVTSPAPGKPGPQAAPRRCLSGLSQATRL